MSVAAGGGTLFSLEGHKGVVTGIALLPVSEKGGHDSTTVVTSSMDGTLRMWDIADGSATKVIKIGLPVRHMVLSPDGSKAYLTTIKLPRPAGADTPAGGATPAPLGTPGTPGAQGKEGKTGSAVQEMVLTAAKPQLRRLFKCRHVAKLSVTSDGVLVAGARKNVFVWREGMRDPVKLKHERDISSVAVHSEHRFVAAADDRGEIFLWYNVLDEGGDAPVRSSQMHWHSQAVRAMCVSAEGGYLFSGGEEAVLVIWQLGSGQKSFLPRLGGAIEAIAACPDGMQLAMLCEGGKIRVIDMQTRKLIKSIRLAGLAISAPKALAEGANMLCEASGLGLVAVCGTSGTDVEVWDVKGSMVGSLEVVPRNYVKQAERGDGAGGSRGDRDGGQPRLRVQIAAFSGDGESMAVVHGREKGGGSKGGDAHFQLSMWRHTQGRWKAESRVLSPHKEAVTSVSFGPQPAKGTSSLLLSSGTDGLFKVWRREARPQSASVNSNRKEGEGELTWRCQSVCGLRPVSCGASAFSQDGSVVAAAYAHTVCICAYPSLGLLTAMTNTSCRQPINRIAFLPQSSCLIAATHQSVSMWDVSTGSLRWAYTLSPLAMAMHPSLPLVALSVRSGVVGGGTAGKRHVLLCKAENAAPTHTWEVESGGGTGLVWSKGTGGGSKAGGERLLVLQSRGFSALEMGGGESGAEKGSGKKVEAAPEEGKSAFDRMMGGAGSKRGEGKEGVNPLLVGTPTAHGAMSLVEGPSHVLGAPSMLLNSFLKALLPAPLASGDVPRGETAGSAGVEEEGKGGGGKKKGKKGSKRGEGAGDGEDSKDGSSKVEKKASGGGKDSKDMVGMSVDDDEELSFALPKALNLYADD